MIVALINAQLIWLAVAALIFALIGAYYYLRVVMYMYFRCPIANIFGTEPVPVALDMKIAITLNGAAALLLGILPGALMELCRLTA